MQKPGGRRKLDCKDLTQVSEVKYRVTENLEMMLKIWVGLHFVTSFRPSSGVLHSTSEQEELLKCFSRAGC
jgi:hypothetical protein